MKIRVLGGVVALCLTGCVASVSEVRDFHGNIAPGDGVLAVSVDSSTSFDMIRITRPDDTFAAIVARSLPEGRSLHFVEVPAGEYQWVRVDLSDGIYGREYVPLDENKKQRYTFTVKPGVINYPGDFVVEQNSDNANRYYIQLIDRSAMLLKAMSSAQLEMAERIGLQYVGPGNDDFLDRYKTLLAGGGTAIRTVRSMDVVKHDFSEGIIPAPSAVSAAAKLKVSDFFHQSVLRSAVLSPSGRYVIDLDITDDGRQRVTLIDLDAQTSADIIEADETNEYFTNIQLASDDTLIMYVNFGNDARQLIVSKWTTSKDGKPQVKNTIWPSGYWVLDRLVHDGAHQLIAHDEGSGRNACTCIYLTDGTAGPDALKKLKPIYSVDQGPIWIVTDRDGHLRLKETRDDKDVRHYFLYVSDAAGQMVWKEFKQIADEKQVFTPEAFAPDGNDFYVLSNIGRSTIGYFEYDPATDKFVRTLYANDDADVYDTHYDAWSANLSYLTWYKGTDVHYEVLDPRAQHYIGALHEAFPGRQVVPWGIAADGHDVLVYTYSDQDPGTYYAFDSRTNKAELLGAEDPWLNPKEMSPTAAGSIKTKDGFSLNYLLVLPKEGKKPYPLVVIPHGGPIGVFNVNGFDPEAQLLASRGYAVLKVNYRGSGGNGKGFEEAGKKQWGRKIEDDIEQAVQVALKDQPLDANRICIYGGSYGGYSALMSVIRNPGLYKCAASFAGVTDLPLLYDTTDVQFDKEVRDDMADIIGDPTTDAQQLHAVSPVYLADKLQRPVLIGQGGMDMRVDEEQAYRMKLVMDTLGKPNVAVFYPDDAHGFSWLDDEADFDTRLLSFLDQNIGDRRGVAPGSMKVEGLTPHQWSKTGICSLLSKSAAESLLGVQTDEGTERDLKDAYACSYAHDDQMAVVTVQKGEKVNEAFLDESLPSTGDGWSKPIPIPGLGEKAKYTSRGTTAQLFVLVRSQLMVWVTVYGDARSDLQQAMTEAVKSAIAVKAPVTSP